MVLALSDRYAALEHARPQVIAIAFVVHIIVFIVPVVWLRVRVRVMLRVSLASGSKSASC